MKKLQKPQASPVVMTTQRILAIVLSLLVIIHMLTMFKIITIPQNAVSAIKVSIYLLIIITSLLSITITTQTKQGYYRSRRLTAATRRHIFQIYESHCLDFVSVLNNWDKDLLAVGASECKNDLPLKIKSILSQANGYTSYWRTNKEKENQNSLDSYMPLLLSSGIQSIVHYSAEGETCEYYRFTFDREKYAPLLELWYVPNGTSPRKLEPELVKKADPLNEKWFYVTLRWVYG